MKYFYILSILILLCYLPLHAQNSEATYTVSYVSSWSETTHPHPTGNFPAGAHYSKLVGATHNDAVIFVEMGALASQGVEDIAELGDNAAFFNEVTAAIAAGNANQIIDGDALNTSTGEILIDNVVTDEAYPLLTLLSMIAPSPDWMIASNSIELLDSNGDWKDEIVIDLYPYDAGTDSGSDYNSPNMNTDPPQPVSNHQGIPPFSNEKVGTLTVSLENVILEVENPDITDFRMFPNPAQDIVTIASGIPIASIEIINVLGERVKFIQIDSKESVIDIEDLASGIYMVKVSGKEGVSSVKKLIKR